MIDSGHGLILTVTQVHGFVFGGLLIVIHPVIGVATCDPDTSQSPREFERSLDRVDELLMVSLFPQFYERLSAAGSGLFTDVTMFEGSFVLD